MAVMSEAPQSESAEQNPYQPPSQPGAPSRPPRIHPLTIVLVLIEFAAILTEVIRGLGSAVAGLLVLMFNFLILLSVGFTCELLLRRRTRPWQFRLIALAVIVTFAGAYLAVPFEGEPRWLVDVPIALGIGCVGYLYLWACGMFVQNVWQSWARR